MSNQLQLIPKNKDIRTRAELEDAISTGTKSKVSFTVSIQSDIDFKFKEIMSHYQTKFPYGKVHKHYVLQLIIDEVHTRMQKQGLISYESKN